MDADIQTEKYQFAKNILFKICDSYSEAFQLLHPLIINWIYEVMTAKTYISIQLFTHFFSDKYGFYCFDNSSSYATNYINLHEISYKFYLYFLQNIIYPQAKPEDQEYISSFITDPEMEEYLNNTHENPERKVFGYSFYVNKKYPDINNILLNHMPFLFFCRCHDVYPIIKINRNNYEIFSKFNIILDIAQNVHELRKIYGYDTSYMKSQRIAFLSAFTKYKKKRLKEIIRSRRGVLAKIYNNPIFDKESLRLIMDLAGIHYTRIKIDLLNS